MTLVKLKIGAYSDAACSTAVEPELEVMFNPETYKRTFTVEYADSEVAGESASTKLFKKIKGGDLALKLVADGTGVVALPSGISSVDDYITKIKRVAVGYDGSAHRTNFLKIVWGKASIICVCNSLDVTYSLFKPDGTTLRAVMDLALSETVDFVTKEAAAGKNSPDLTHLRIVKAGDTLPLMCYRIYGNSSYYLEIARINGLASILAIRPGDKIYFPPIKK